jgi:hypothetical protein
MHANDDSLLAREGLLKLRSPNRLSSSGRILISALFIGSVQTWLWSLWKKSLGVAGRPRHVAGMPPVKRRHENKLLPAHCRHAQAAGSGALQSLAHDLYLMAFI